MSVHVWPVAAVEGSPEYVGRSLRQTMAPLLAGATSTRPLGAISGVRPGTSVTTVEADSTTWTVHPHAGVLDVQSAAEAGPYSYSIDADVVDDLDPAHATWPRWDGIYVCVDDPAESDGSEVPAVRVEYVAGTAASSPAMPTAPDRSMLLARIVVPASGGGSPSVVWLAPTMAAAGGVVHFASTTARDAWKSAPEDGLLCTTGADTTLAEWIGQDGAWVELWSANSGRPYRQASGVATVASGNPVGTVDVTLPAGRFTQTPIVIATPDNSQYVAQYVPGNSSSSSIRIGIRQIAGGTWSTPRLAYWTAVQMTPSNPEG